MHRHAAHACTHTYYIDRIAPPWRTRGRSARTAPHIKNLQINYILCLHIIRKFIIMYSTHATRGGGTTCGALSWIILKRRNRILGIYWPSWRHCPATLQRGNKAMKTRQNYSPHRIEIDNTATFLNWAKTVQFDVTHWARPRCDYQDDYARTSREVIDAAFNGATPDERRVILCAVYNTMSYDEVERLLLVRAKDVRRVEMAAAYAELDEADRKRGAALARREDAINAREHALKEAAKPIHKRLAEQRRQIDTLRRQLDDATRRADVAREERNASKLQALEYEIKAGRFDTIRAALIGEV